MLVTSEERGQVLVIRIDREAKRNAINREVALGIESALDVLEERSDLRVAVLTGSPSIFSAGTDLKDGHGARTERGGEYGVIRRRRRKPLIAAVEGAALGGGFEIVLACDLVVASSQARFGLPEGLRGVLPTSGALFLASRALPRNVATRMLLTGEDLSSKQGYDLGLVNEVTEPGGAVERAVELGELVCRAAPTSVTQILLAQQQLVVEQDARGWQATTDALQFVLDSADMKEGAAAFFEKRAPEWPGT